MRWLTSNDILLGVTIAVVALSSFLGYGLILLLGGYMKVLRLSKLQTVLPSEDTKWLEHFGSSTTVRMMMTTGTRILDSERSIVYRKLLDLPVSWKGKVRILLLHPNSKFIPLRARSRSVSDEMVRSQILASAGSIKNLKSLTHLDIEVRYYWSVPAWRFVLFDKVGYFSYMSQGRFLNSYLKISKGNDGLYEALSDIFDLEWESSKENVET